MKSQYFLNKIIMGAWMMLAMAFVHAGTPLWTFMPLTETKIMVTANGTATVLYQITNQSTKPHTLVMKAIPGITQVTTAGYCPNPFILGYQQSCILNLSINGNALNGNVLDGPDVCQQGGLNKCYRPDAANILQITKDPAMNYTVGGSTYGLIGTLVLENNGDALTLNADGSFTFPNTLAQGSSYLVTIQSQPPTQICTLSNGSGIITNANVTNLTVNCSTNTRTLGGSVAGLASAESVVLQNNGGDNLIANSNGSFTFSTPVAQGATYNVTVLTQPTSQTCTVTNGSGIAGTSDITNVHVSCATNAYTVGGTVSGLTGTVVLRNNLVNELSISHNGTFTFSLPIPQGANYHVTVATQPEGQTCAVANGSGTVGGADVTNVGVTCATNTAILTTSISDLALSVRGLTEYGITPTPPSGRSRLISLTNIGSSDATNISVTLPTMPEGTTISSGCGRTLKPGFSCPITITPGFIASSDGTNPCSTNGTAPVPGVVRVTADNASTVSANVVILNYNCIYQGGYVYAFDDTTPNTQSVGGKVLTTTNQGTPAPGAEDPAWSPFNEDTGNWDFTAIFGIAENSTPLAPNPSTKQVPEQAACTGATDGSCNTNNIYLYYQNKATNYATGACKQTISGYSDWYLPAICELGFENPNGGIPGSGCGNASSPRLQNALSNIHTNVFSGEGEYWSSTEFTDNPAIYVWAVEFGVPIDPFSGIPGTILDVPTKSIRYGIFVRCSRALSTN